MRAAGVPTIHLDQIPELARQYQLPMAPTQMPAVGDGGPFRDATRVRLVAGIFALVLIIALVAARIFALTPASEEQFDPYFGSAGFRVRRRVNVLLRRGDSVLKLFAHLIAPARAPHTHELVVVRDRPPAAMISRIPSWSVWVTDVPLRTALGDTNPFVSGPQATTPNEPCSKR
jgi:hypothetical protein